eukprot:scaffold111668_cov22-Tisochrysis_lutea.AAC.1
MKVAADRALIVDPRARHVVREIASHASFVPEAQALGEARTVLRGALACQEPRAPIPGGG